MACSVYIKVGSRFISYVLVKPYAKRKPISLLVISGHIANIIFFFLRVAVLGHERKCNTIHKMMNSNRSGWCHVTRN